MDLRLSSAKKMKLKPLWYFFSSRLEWKNFEVVNNQPKHIFVRDVLSEAKENLGKK